MQSPNLTQPKAPSQRDRVLSYLAGGRTLTRLNAWDELGVLEAPARISELRRAGHQIHTEMIEVKNRYGETVKVAKWRLLLKDCPICHGAGHNGIGPSDPDARTCHRCKGEGEVPA